MKPLNPKIRKMIESLYEEINKENHENDFRELKKKTVELREFVSEKMPAPIKDGHTGKESEDAIYPIGELVQDSIKRLEIRSRDKERRFFITTGFEQMDKMIGGFEPGEVVVVGARTGMGKTSLMLSMINQITRKSDHAAGFLSLEFPASHLAERLISAEAEVPVVQMRRAKLSVDDWNRIIDGIGNIRKRKIFIVSNPGCSVGNIRDVAERLARDHGISLS